VLEILADLPARTPAEEAVEAVLHPDRFLGATVVRLSTDPGSLPCFATEPAQSRVVMDKVTDHPDAGCRGFLASSTFALVGTSDREGRHDVPPLSPQTEGAVAISSVLRRSWPGIDRRRHHLLDPVTGEPAVTDLVAVTTCSAQVWWAEAAARAALLAGAEAAPDML
jgi:hypothetical protein